MEIPVNEVYYSKLLSSYISHFSYFKITDTNRQPLFMMPLGAIQIIFQLKNTIWHRTNFSNGWDKRPDVFIGGPFTAAYDLRPEPNTELLGVLLLPGKSRYFFPNKLSELKNKLVHPEVIWGLEGRQLVEQIYLANDNPKRVELLEQFLMAQFRKRNPSPVEKTINSLVMDQGMGRISDWAGRAGLSVAHFRRRFGAEMGLSPKEYQKIIRINQLTRFYLKNPQLSLTELGYEFGYFDQAHFIKDFKSLTGQTPRHFFRS